MNKYIKDGGIYETRMVLRNEFKNKIIHEVLTIFDIDRAFSQKGCPYDNAVAEATYKIIG